MSSSLIPSVAPIALQPGEGDARWFLGFLITIKSTAEITNGRVAVIEHFGTQGLGSPLHVHRNEDEWFYVTEGELTFWVGGETINAPAGSFVYEPATCPTPSSSPQTKPASCTEADGLSLTRSTSAARPARGRLRTTSTPLPTPARAGIAEESCRLPDSWLGRSRRGALECEQRPAVPAIVHRERRAPTAAENV